MSNPDVANGSGPLERSLPVFAAITGVLTLCVFLYQFRQAFSNVSDLIEFLAVAKMTASGHGAQIYVVPELMQTEHFLYPVRGHVIFFIPPFGLPWLMPLALFAPNIAPDICKGFLVICFGVSLWILQRVYKLSFNATCWFIAASCMSGCTYDALRLDQTTTFMLLGLSVAIFALKKNRPYLASIALSVMLLKPQLLLPFLFFVLGAKRYRCVGTLVLCAIVLLAVGTMLVGIDGWHNYLSLMQSTVDSDQYLGTMLSCTLRGQLFRLMPEHRIALHYVCVIVVGLTCAWAFKVGRERAASSNWTDCGLFAVLPLTVVTSLYCFYYDVLLLMPAMLVFAQSFRRILPAWSLWLTLCVMLLFMPPVSTYLHYNWVLKDQPFNPQFAILAIFAIASIYLYRRYLKNQID